MDGSENRWWSNLASEIRQAFFGAVFALLLTAVAAVLLAAFAGEVPAWTLAVSIVVAVVLILASGAARAREQGRLAGELQAERRRREATEQERDEARRRLAELDGGTAVGPAQVDPRVRSLLFRIQSLRGEAQMSMDKTAFTTEAQDRALSNLARDLQETFGPAQSVQSILDEFNATSQGGRVANLLTALGEIEGALVAQDESGTLWNVQPKLG